MQTRAIRSKRGNFLFRCAIDGVERRGGVSRRHFPANPENESSTVVPETGTAGTRAKRVSDPRFPGARVSIRDNCRTDRREHGGSFFGDEDSDDESIIEEV